MYLPARRLLQAPLFFSIIVSLCACDAQSLSKLCAESLPGQEKGLEAAVLALAPWDGDFNGPGRSLASDRKIKGLEMDERDRKYWIEWSARQLKQVQSYIDRVKEDPSQGSLYRQLSVMANNWVRFHGYAQSGNAARMISTLGQIQEGAQTARKMACKAP